MYRYAEASVRSKLGVSAQRSSLWLRGYQRFGDEFEAAFAELKGNFRTMKRAARMHRVLEERLADPWMLLGARLDELHPSVQDAWEVFRFHRDTVVRVWLREPEPPDDWKAIYMWATDGQDFDWERLGKSWTDVVTKDFGMTLPELRRIIGYGLTRDEAKKCQRRGLRSFSQFAAHFEDGIPVEYILAV